MFSKNKKEKNKEGYSILNQIQDMNKMSVIF